MTNIWARQLEKRKLNLDHGFQNSRSSWEGGCGGQLTTWWTWNWENAVLSELLLLFYLIPPEPWEAAQERGTAVQSSTEMVREQNPSSILALPCERAPPTSKAGLCLLSRNKLTGNLWVYLTGLWASRSIKLILKISNHVILNESVDQCSGSDSKGTDCVSLTWAPSHTHVRVRAHTHIRLSHTH